MSVNSPISSRASWADDDAVDLYSIRSLFGSHCSHSSVDSTLAQLPAFAQLLRVLLHVGQKHGALAAGSNDNVLFCGVAAAQNAHACHSFGRDPRNRVLTDFYSCLVQAAVGASSRHESS